MSDIRNCLSVFAVAAWANRDDGLRLADDAIDDYLASVSTSDRRAALDALRTAYSKMCLDSQVAIAIRESIDLRIEALARPRSTPARQDDHA